MSEIQMLIGVPGSGKSSGIDLTQPGTVCLSRDKEGGKTTDLLPKVAGAISAGAKKVILDCTFVKRADRTPFIELAKARSVPIHATFYDIKPEEAQFNICWRMCQRYGKVLRTPADYKAVAGDPNMFPPMVLFTMLKIMKEEGKPLKEEGFTTFNVVKPARWKLPPEFKNRALMVDYDGTVRKTKSGANYPKSVDDIEVSAKAAKKLQALRDEGWLLLGASNQSGVANNDPPMDVAHACFQRTNKDLGVEIEYNFDYSPAGPVSSWHRKPMPGMGVDAIWKHKLDPSLVLFIGDLTTDKTFAERSHFQYDTPDRFFQ